MTYTHTVTNTDTIPVTHAHLVKNNETSGLEAFVSSAGVELSISCHTGRNSRGVIGSGNYERLKHYNFGNIEENLFNKKLLGYCQVDSIPISTSELKSVSSEYPGASGDFYHVVFGLDVKQEQVEAVFTRLNIFNPKAY